MVETVAGDDELDSSASITYLELDALPVGAKEFVLVIRLKMDSYGGQHRNTGNPASVIGLIGSPRPHEKYSWKEVLRVHTQVKCAVTGAFHNL